MENRQWGSGDINTILWIKDNNQWPINDALIIGPNTPIISGYESIDLSNGNKFIFTRNYTTLPIIKFKLTEGKVWFNSYNHQTSEGRKLYALLDYGSCNIFKRFNVIDPRYFEVGQIREDRLFKDNEIYESLSHLPNFPINDSSKYEWKLYYNNAFYWSHYWDGDANINRESFYSALEGLIHIKDKNNYILEIAIFHALFTWLVLQYFFWYFTILIFCNKEEINKAMRNIFHIVGYPIKIIGLIFLVYFWYVWLVWIATYQDIVIKITIVGWAPDFTSQQLFKYEEYLQTVHHMAYKIIVLSVVSFVLVILDLIWELTIRGILQSVYGRFYDDSIK